MNLNKSSTTLQIVDGIKGEEQLEVELVGITGTVNWSSSDTTKVKVIPLEDTTKAIIRAEAVTIENVEITASFGEESSVCTVKVEEKKSITGITFDSTNPQKVNVGSTAQIKVSKIIPEDATEILNWSIAEEDTSKATITEVSADGKTATIRGDNEGTVIIKVQNANGDLTNNTANLKVEVPEYLVDKVNIGDYVNIGISKYSGGYKDEWRVLSKVGSGKDGYVTLISTGAPITYYMYTNADKAISDLENLNSITIESGTGEGKEGFRSDTIMSSSTSVHNLNTYLNTNSIYYDETRGIHSFSFSELSTLYTNITGTTRTMSNFVTFGQNTTLLEDQRLQNDMVSGKEWKESYAGLLTNGGRYWVAGENYDSWNLVNVNSLGNVYRGNNERLNIRPIISLKKGVLKAGGNGSSIEDTFTLSF